MTAPSSQIIQKHCFASLFAFQHRSRRHKSLHFLPSPLPPPKSSETASRLSSLEHASGSDRAADVSSDLVVSGSAVVTPARVADGGAAPAFEEISDFSKEGADRLTGPVDSDLRADFMEIGNDGSGVERRKLNDEK